MSIDLNSMQVHPSRRVAPDQALVFNQQVFCQPTMIAAIFHPRDYFAQLEWLGKFWVMEAMNKFDARPSVAAVETPKEGTN